MPQARCYGNKYRDGANGVDDDPERNELFKNAEHVVRVLFFPNYIETDSGFNLRVSQASQTTRSRRERVVNIGGSIWFLRVYCWS